jgi:hypothetical protein
MLKCHSENLGSTVDAFRQNRPEMFRFAQHDSGVEMTVEIDQKNFRAFSMEMSGILESAT